MSRWQARSLASLIAAATAAGVGTWMIVGGGQADEGAKAAERQAEFARCPSLAAPAGSALVLTRRTLHNLGRNLIGVSERYSAGTRWLELHVGFDALDEYEDLDFGPASHVTLQGRPVPISTARALSGKSAVQAATWLDARFPPRCRQLTAVGRMPLRAFERILPALRIVRRPAA